MLPMSIIIIGVGAADFTNMEILDGDNGILKNRQGKPAMRDIVQFVPMRNYANDITFLHEDVLREVPRQLVSFMTSNNIIPAPTQHAEINSMS